MTLASTHGYVTLPEAASLGLRFVDGTKDKSKLLRFRATEQSANVALEGLVWQADLDWYGAAWLNVTVNDLGFSGSGGPKNDTQSIPIFVNPVNDRPVLKVPENVLSVAEDHKIHVPCDIFDAGDNTILGFIDGLACQILTRICMPNQGDGRTTTPTSACPASIC